MAGTVDILFEPILNALPLYRAGKVRILGVSSLRRQESMPKIATISESVPGFEAVGWHAVFAPRGTPDPTVQRLNQVFDETLRARDVAERLTSLGMTVSGGSSQQVVQAIKDEGDKWSRLIAEIGLKLD